MERAQWSCKYSSNNFSMRLVHQTFSVHGRVLRCIKRVIDLTNPFSNLKHSSILGPHLLPNRPTQKDLPKPKHEVYLRGVRPVPPCVLTEGPRRGTDFGGCLATAKPNFGQPESVSLLT